MPASFSLTCHSVFRLMRVHQAIKNFFIFAPLFFAAQLTEIPLLINTLMAFIAFSFGASVVYIFNDYMDIEDDQKHPQKKYRPLAAGDIKKSQAILIMLPLGTLSMMIMGSISISATAILLFYMVLNVLYSMRLKHVPICDVIIVAIGFVLRLFVGFAVTGVAFSMWIAIMTFLLALFMALAKRRDDILIGIETGEKMRRVVDGYNLQFLDSAITITVSVLIVAYIIYTTSSEMLMREHGEYLYATSLFVILGILRYLQVTLVLEDSGSPTKIVLKDRILQGIILCWVLCFLWILYF